MLRTMTVVVGLSLAATAVGGEQPRVKLETSQGDIVIELFDQRAPKTVENFLAYVDAGFYDGTLFHRVIPGFMIQGGGYTSDYRRKETRAPIPNESDNGLENQRGTVAMARTSSPDSATSQFFINVADNGNLDYRDGRWGYAVFGQVVKGMSVVDAIVSVPTGPAGPFRQDAPREPVLIKKAVRVGDD